jgi:hypothetical protein
VRVKRRLIQALTAAALLLVAAGIAAPFLHADRYRDRIQAALSSALGRQVTIDGSVTLNVFTGPGLAVSNVVIAGRGAEPFAYVDEMRATPRLWSFWTGRLEFSSLTLDGAHVNLSRTVSNGSAAWNFESLLRPGLLATFPTIRVRDSRINFKSGDRKLTFYLLNADLDISPRSSDGSDWQLRFAGEPARSDRPARGFGSVEARGHWKQTAGGPGKRGADRLELDVSLERSEIGALIALVKGSDAGIQGRVAGQVHVSGPMSNLGVEGEVHVSELHGWDESPPPGGVFDFRLSGTVDTPAQHVELFAEPKSKLAVVKAHLVEDSYRPTLFEVRSDAFPIAALPGLLHNFGARIPDGLRVSGSMRGDIHYTPADGWTGAAAIQDAALDLPGTPELRFEQASFALSGGAANVGPVNILSGTSTIGAVGARYSIDNGAFEVDLTSDGGPLTALLQQFPGAGVPLLSSLAAGNWSGDLEYAQPASGPARWSGVGTLAGASATCPALSQPVAITSAHVRLDGAEIQMDHLKVRAGGMDAEGDYRYVPGAVRPHQFHLSTAAADLAQIEALFRPVLERNTNLIDLALSLGRTRVPDWLHELHMEGAIQADTVGVAGSVMRRVRSRVLWDGTQVMLPDLQARLVQGTVAGRVAVDLRDAMPRYIVSAKVKGLEWRNGSVAGSLHLDTSGMGLDTLANLKLDGAFEAGDIDGTPLGTLDHVAGTYALSWSGAAPKIRLTQLRIENSDGEIWTGSGGSQGGAGEVLLQLSNKGRQVSLAGSLTEPAKNWVEQ